MASAGDILIVRNNTNQTDTSVLGNVNIGLLIDELGVIGASAQLWHERAAQLAEEVDVTEAGASHKFSDLFAHAKEMALLWQRRADLKLLGRVRVKVIDRQ